MRRRHHDQARRPLPALGERGLGRGHWHGPLPHLLPASGYSDRRCRAVRVDRRRVVLGAHGSESWLPGRCRAGTRWRPNSPAVLALSYSITFGRRSCSLRDLIRALRCSTKSVKVLDTMTWGTGRGRWQLSGGIGFRAFSGLEAQTIHPRPASVKPWVSADFLRCGHYISIRPTGISQNAADHCGPPGVSDPNAVAANAMASWSAGGLPPLSSAGWAHELRSGLVHSIARGRKRRLRSAPPHALHDAGALTGCTEPLIPFCAYQIQGFILAAR